MDDPLFAAIRAVLAEYAGTWILPADLDALTELCVVAVQKARGEWVRAGGGDVEYEV